MSEQKILDAAMNAFKRTLTDCCRNQPGGVGRKLSPGAMAVLTKIRMEAAGSAGRSGLAEYLRRKDTREPWVCVKGVRYRYKNSIDKTFLTLFGNVVVKRSMYGNDVVGGYVAPLDRALGLAGDESATLEGREMILLAASSSTPEEVATLLGRASLCWPSRSTIQSIIVRDGRRREADRGTIAEKVRPSESIPEDARVLAASMDGVKVRLREPGVKRGRKPQRPRDGTDDDGASSTSFRNAMVGSFSWYRRKENGEALRLSSCCTARLPEDKAPYVQRGV